MKRILSGAAALAIVAALVLNVSGVVPFPGGPLREWKDGGLLWLDMWPSDWGNNARGNQPGADWAVPGAELVYSSALRPDDWPWPVEVERITPVDVSGNLVVTRSLLLPPGGTRASDLWVLGSLTADQRVLLEGALKPLPQAVQPGGDGQQFALTFQGPREGPSGWEAVAVDYRVGPFSFRAVLHSAVHLCLGNPSPRDICPEDS